MQQFEISLIYLMYETWMQKKLIPRKRCHIVWYVSEDHNIECIWMYKMRWGYRGRSIAYWCLSFKVYFLAISISFSGTIDLPHLHKQVHKYIESFTCIYKHTWCNGFAYIKRGRINLKKNQLVYILFTDDVGSQLHRLMSAVKMFNSYSVSY